MVFFAEKRIPSQRYHPFFMRDRKSKADSFTIKSTGGGKEGAKGKD
jgi:hypothetical protein